MTLDEYAAQWVDMRPHLATLYRLARDADRILEMGVRGGVSTWAMLDGLKPDGSLTSVDVVDVRPDLPERITDDVRWTFLHGDDREVPLPRADLAFIDTSHEYHHTLAELRRASDGGAQAIALHDWNLPDVQDAVRGWCDRTRWHISALEPSEWGLVVLS